MQPANLNTKQSTIHIRNMVCDSCVKIVRMELERTGFIKVDHVELGKAVISFNEQVIGLSLVDEILKNSGFSLIDDREDNIEQWKSKGGIGILFKSTDQVKNHISSPINLFNKNEIFFGIKDPSRDYNITIIDPETNWIIYNLNNKTK